MTDVAGGLDQPAELQPEPGALALASAHDDWSRSDWERAAATVLRKAGRLGADDPDDAVWSALARTTYDGIAITPLGTPPASRPGHERSVRQRTGAWDVRTRTAGDNAAAVEDLENGATRLWLVADDLASTLAGVLLDLAPGGGRASGSPQRCPSPPGR